MLTRWVPQNSGVERSSSIVPSVDSLFDEAFTIFRQPFFFDGASAGRWPMMALGHGADITESETEVQVSLDLPGYDPKSLQVKLEGETLTIEAERKRGLTEKVRSLLSGEREYGRYARSFVLPNTIDGSKCQATYEHGVLTVTLPKRDEARPRVVDVKVYS